MDERAFCHYCGPGYRYGDEGCRHTPPTKLRPRAAWGEAAVPNEQVYLDAGVAWMLSWQPDAPEARETAFVGAQDPAFRAAVYSAFVAGHRAALDSTDPEEAAPRTWRVPEIPPDVLALQTRWGTIWRRDGDGWRAGRGDPWNVAMLLQFGGGELTDATALAGTYPDVPAPGRLPMCPACEIEHAPPMHYDAVPAPGRSGEEDVHEFDWIGFVDEDDEYAARCSCGYRVTAWAEDLAESELQRHIDEPRSDAGLPADGEERK